VIISILVAVDERGGIGRNNLLPWHPRKALLSAVARRPQADEAIS
jgi:dihydrofolate reductase